jgi:Delta7-sterol 5-desaturase
VQGTLAWALRRDLAEAVALSLLVNVLVFAGALAAGAVVARVWAVRRVAAAPPPLSRAEAGLAAATVALNSAVMLAGWALCRAGVLAVDGSSSVWRWLVDAAALTLLMDLAMYASHRLAHAGPIYRRVHGLHHRYEDPRPLTLFVLHPLEVLGFGGLWIALLCTHAFSLGGMLLYLTFNTLFGTLGHVGVEPLPAAFARWPLLRRVGTSTFHARHHQRPRHNFGFYTTIWDRLFGTLDPDYEAGFARPLARPPQAREG